MPDAPTPTVLVATLRSAQLRSRTGILLLEPSHFGKEEAIAVQLGIESLDYAHHLNKTLPEKTTYVSINAITEEKRLYDIAQSREGMQVVLVYNFDIALSKLALEDRTNLWSNLRYSFAKSVKALLFAVPEAATHLLPQDTERSPWEEGKRIAKMI